VWKAVMGLAANHAAMAAPMQAMTEISLGILLVIGLLTRPAAFVAFLYLGSLWISEWGTAWIWELLVPVLASRGWRSGGHRLRGGVFPLSESFAAVRRAFDREGGHGNKLARIFNCS
jgi:DoxX